MSVITIAIAIQGVSALLLLFILFEYRHIHQKRVALLQSLASQKIGSMLLERYVLMAIYILSTIVVMILPFAVYL